MTKYLWNDVLCQTLAYTCIQFSVKVEITDHVREPLFGYIQ